MFGWICLQNTKTDLYKTPKDISWLCLPDIAFWHFDLNVMFCHHAILVIATLVSCLHSGRYWREGWHKLFHPAIRDASKWRIWEEVSEEIFLNEVRMRGRATVNVTLSERHSSFFFCFHSLHVTRCRIDTFRPMIHLTVFLKGVSIANLFLSSCLSLSYSGRWLKCPSSPAQPKFDSRLKRHP